MSFKAPVASVATRRPARQRNFRLRLQAPLLSMLAILAVHSTSGAAWAADLALVRDGVPASVIVLPANADQAEQQAADELVEHLQLMSGATLPIISADEPVGDRVAIRIGGAADAAIDDMIRQRGDDPWAFALVVEADVVQLRGLSPQGTRTAAYELLEQLGVRWYMPGEIGREVPQRATVTLDAQRTVQVPSFTYRKQSSRYEAWSARMRLGGHGRRAGQHNISAVTRRQYGESHPEYFAIVNPGTDRERRTGQLCLTHEKVLQISVDHYREQLRNNPQLGLAGRTDSPPILHLGPADGAGFCECDGCTALDPEAVTTPFRPTSSMTDRYLWFYNRLLEELADEFPDVKIGFYAYASTNPPPRKFPMDPERYEVTLYPILQCRIHGVNNPACPESHYPRYLLEQWSQHANVVWDGSYWFNLAGPGLPFSMVHRLREDIPTSYELGSRWLSGDFGAAWASQNPSMYVAAKLMWDHAVDVDAVLADFYAGFYGPAEAPMASYHTLMDTTIRDADHHSGSTWDFPLIYPKAVRDKARSYIEEAQSLVEPGSAYATRVELTGRSLDLLDAYVTGREARLAYDFVAERGWNEQAERIRDSLGTTGVGRRAGELGDFEFPMLAWHARAYLNRFTTDYASHPEISGYSRVTDGNEFIVGLDHEWQFQLDPERWGQYIGLHKPEVTGGNWRTIRTDTTWSNQGLRYYFSQAWYRQRVDLPDTHHGRTIRIWFAGVDRTADVWVNGQHVGSNHSGVVFDLDAHGSSFRPFEFDVTDVIRRGEPNVVSVRVYRPSTAELGTGGIMGPVMFYAAAE